jgi:hypothetical protein
LAKKQLTEEERFEKRQAEITRALQEFTKSYSKKFDTSDFQIYEDTPYLITKLYYKILPKVKEFIDDKTIRFKIASLTELCIIRLQPFKNQNDIKAQREMNANFAFYISVSLFASMDPASYDKTFSISPLEDFFEDIKRKHVEWLSIKKKKMMCVISNEHTLYLIHGFFTHRWSSMMR